MAGFIKALIPAFLGGTGAGLGGYAVGSLVQPYNPALTPAFLTTAFFTISFTYALWNQLTSDK